MSAYYNEIDPYAAQWLRNLIAAGHIAPGEVDERSILDVKPDDLRGFTQCHFFAGIGVWSYALRRAGWPDDQPVWTGSCPCQPFSSAGMARGFADERHLWPIFHFLIEERRPPVVFGEQVASKDGLNWLDLVQADMEGTGYAFAAVDLCAAGVGAPHIRQRLWFVAERLANPQCRPSERHGHSLAAAPGGVQSTAQEQRFRADLGYGEHIGGVADPNDDGLQGCTKQTLLGARGRQEGDETRRGESSLAVGMADAEHNGYGGSQADATEQGGNRARDGLPDRSASGLRNAAAGPTNSHWRDADWLFCRDGKWRPVEPGTFPLAHGATSRVGRLRAYGNAIVAEAAEAVISAYMEGVQ